MNNQILFAVQRARVLLVNERFGLLGRKDAERLLLPSIRMHAGSALADSAIHLGASKLGGLPDLPPGMDWPQVEVPKTTRAEQEKLRRYFQSAALLDSLGDERALPFLCQVSLAELAPWDLQRALPGKGLLLFFYDAGLDMVLNTLGDNPLEQRDFRAWRVLYVEDGLQVQRAAPPEGLGPQQRFAPCPVSFRLEWMLPPHESPLLDRSLDVWRYLDLLEAIARMQPEAHDPKGSLHRLLGYEQPIQADVSYYLSAVSREPGASELDPKGWRLVLQLDSDEDVGMKWFDAGSVYFCLQQTDLEERRFDAARGVVQFH